MIKNLIYSKQVLYMEIALTITIENIINIHVQLQFYLQISDSL